MKHQITRDVPLFELLRCAKAEGSRIENVLNNKFRYGYNEPKWRWMVDLAGRYAQRYKFLAAESWEVRERIAMRWGHSVGFDNRMPNPFVAIGLLSHKKNYGCVATVMDFDSKSVAAARRRQKKVEKLKGTRRGQKMSRESMRLFIIQTELEGVLNECA